MLFVIESECDIVFSVVLEFFLGQLAILTQLFSISLIS